MLSLTVSPNSEQRLVDQIVAGIKRQIQDRHLRPGAKLPSIRNFAETHSVSRFTVVEAYDRLVAMAICGRAVARASIRRTRLRLRMWRVLRHLTI